MPLRLSRCVLCCGTLARIHVVTVRSSYHCAQLFSALNYTAQWCRNLLQASGLGLYRTPPRKQWGSSKTATRVKRFCFQLVRPRLLQHELRSLRQPGMSSPQPCDFEPRLALTRLSLVNARSEKLKGRYQSREICACTNTLNRNDGQYSHIFVSYYYNMDQFAYAWREEH